jgi:DNA-directed RNA polymerase subunit RPC12/RpoP
MTAATAGAAGLHRGSLSAALQRAQDYRSKAGELARMSPPRYAACPSCGYDMIVTSVAPVFLREGCEDINYTCEKCGTQLRRTVKSG